LLCLAATADVTATTILLRDLKPILSDASRMCNVSSWSGEVCAGKKWLMVGCSGPNNTGFVNALDQTEGCPSTDDFDTSIAYDLVAPASLGNLTGLTRCVSERVSFRFGRSTLPPYEKVILDPAKLCRIVFDRVFTTTAPEEWGQLR
jgi:hypothetical protein